MTKPRPLTDDEIQRVMRWYQRWTTIDESAPFGDDDYAIVKAWAQTCLRTRNGITVISTDRRASSNANDED